MNNVPTVHALTPNPPPSSIMAAGESDIISHTTTTRPDVKLLHLLPETDTMKVVSNGITQGLL
jgi:hypothetical protein